MWGGQSQRFMCSKLGMLISIQAYLFTLRLPKKQYNTIRAFGEERENDV